MVINVKLFGTLREFVADYDPQKGIRIEFTSSATAADVLDYLGIPLSKKPVITCNERLIKISDIIEPGSTLHILQPLGGG